MKKKIIRITESDLNNIVYGSVSQVLNEGWKNWAAAGALGTALMLGNPQAANAQNYDDIYGEQKPKKENVAKYSDDMLNATKKKLSKLDDFHKQLNSANITNTKTINLTDSLKGFENTDPKITLINANNKLTLYHKDLQLSFPLDKNGEPRQAIEMFEKLLMKAKEWKEICESKGIFSLSKQMKDIGIQIPDIEFYFIIRGNKAGVNIIQPEGSYVVGGLYIDIYDMERILKEINEFNKSEMDDYDKRYQEAFDSLM